MKPEAPMLNLYDAHISSAGPNLWAWDGLSFYRWSIEEGSWVSVGGLIEEKGKRKGIRASLEAHVRAHYKTPEGRKLKINAVSLPQVADKIKKRLEGEEPLL